MAEACAGWTDKAGNHHDCRFGDEAADDKFDGKIFCPFHLPMGKPGEGGKADWDNVQQASITDAIIDRIKAKSMAEFQKPEEQRDELDFRGVVVPGLFLLGNETIWALDMRAAQFHRHALLGAAQFHGHTHFDEVQFRGHAKFDEAQFHDDTYFGGAQFQKDAMFQKAQFRGRAEFDKAWFSEYAKFSEAQFHDYTKLAGAQFKMEAWFEKVRFHKDTNFYVARFDEYAQFARAWFQGDALFHATRFNGGVSFREARFHGNVWFLGAQFQKPAVFSGAADPAIVKERAFNVISFHRAQFGGRADFSNREFCDHTDFSGCVFEDAPKFHGSILHQDTAFGGIECFPDVTSGGADRAYRTLRQAMEGHRARAEEGMFYTLEQKARRRKMRRFDPAYWMSLGYELGSNYGFSVVRPLAWLVGGIFASAFLLLGIGWFGGVSADLATMFNKALLFSVRQMFLPFDALRSTDNILAAYTFNPGGTGWLRFWGVVLTLFEGLSALLLVLAIRWRYRR